MADLHRGLLDADERTPAAALGDVATALAGSSGQSWAGHGVGRVLRDLGQPDR